MRSRGERCNPHPHVSADRILRPGDPAYFDISSRLPRLSHVLLPHVRDRQRFPTRKWTPTSAAGTISTLHLRSIRRARRPPTCGDLAQGGGVRLRQRAGPAFALQYGHGIGLSIWEPKPISAGWSRSSTPRYRGGDGLRLETFWPASDGWSAARIEEELVVTATGCEIITRFPARGAARGRTPLSRPSAGPLAAIRETQSHLTPATARRPCRTAITRHPR